MTSTERTLWPTQLSASTTFTSSAKQPKDTADWYADRLGGTITKSATVKDAPQIYVSFGEAFIIVRGQRPGESAKDKAEH